ncbi:SAP1 Protein SAP1 [Candida maltosa Xu316]
MFKSLRPHSNGYHKPQPKLNPKSEQQASTAASASWTKPVSTSQKYHISKSKLKGEDLSLFSDFDQETYVTPSSRNNSGNWEKVSNSRSSSLSTDEPNLIDLDDYFTADGQVLSHSMEDLTIKPIINPERVAVAPPRILAKSTPDVTRTSSTPQPTTKSPYVYNKPKPMNIQKLMKKSTPSPKPAATKPKSNITYNFVRVPTPAPTPRQKTNGAAAPKKQTVKPPQQPKPKPQEEVSSPTMDDLISGYEDHDDSPPVESGPVDPLADQDKFIESIPNIDPAVAKQILNEIVVHGDEVHWEDISGLEGAKNSLKEAVVYPFLRPDLFKGLREPTRGILLFGPPGTGKTMLARAVATESKSTFFNITTGTITSKYLGESEKLIKVLFTLAKKLAPSIVFIDEIDSLLSARTEGEIESSRRIKNEFLIQWSELSSAAAGRDSDGDASRVLVLGATNLPWGLDEAARRRFSKKIYIPLPEPEAIISQIKRLLKFQNHSLTDKDFEVLGKLTEGFSGSDITTLTKDAAMGPLRSLGDALLSTPTEEIRPINLEDFESSLKTIRPSVSKDGLAKYLEWSDKYGSSGV